MDVVDVVDLGRPRLTTKTVVDLGRPRLTTKFCPTRLLVHSSVPLLQVVFRVFVVSRGRPRSTMVCVVDHGIPLPAKCIPRARLLFSLDKLLPQLRFPYWIKSHPKPTLLSLPWPSWRSYLWIKACVGWKLVKPVPVQLHLLICGRHLDN
jgi:hypothetical protein